ncbi:MAG: glucosamine-6-phosphate isomerase [Oscillospiraceae bacterium]|nr:glucosamine-6-phosphate isomerase [Oscillospiraceae bacterium]
MNPRDYYAIPSDTLGKDAKIPLELLPSSEEVFKTMALEMVETITENNEAGEKTVFILPVGPIGQYPIFVREVNERKLSLKNCLFINMDEYLTDDNTYIDIDSLLSFRGFMKREVYGKIDPELLMSESQRLFPDPTNPERIDILIKELGGADICFGGIGLDGHIAFNEPMPKLKPKKFMALPTRITEISLETKVTNGLSDLGGAIDVMPAHAITLGMKSILLSKKIRIGVFRDWHRAVVRHAAYGEASSGFPATLLQSHPDAKIFVNDVASGLPYEAGTA